jgi:hypothetical protein
MTTPDVPVRLLDEKDSQQRQDILDAYSRRTARSRIQHRRMLAALRWVR